MIVDFLFMDGYGAGSAARWIGLVLAGLLLAFALILWPTASLNAAVAESPVDLYFFWSERCPHCLEARPVVLDLAEKAPWLRLHDLEVYANVDNRQQFVAMAAEVGERAETVPAFIFCGRMWTGFGPETGKALAEALRQCRDGVAIQPAPGEEVSPAVPPRDSLWLTTIMLAGMDAFNPCAFFVLLFLLSLLIHTHDRRRMALIGGLFVLTSGVVYFVFMSAWLNLFLWLTELSWLTRIAGLLALTIGVLNLKDSWRPEVGPSLSLSEERKAVLGTRMGALLHSQNTPALVAGTLMLAVTANSYEFLCTAGFPMVYTRLLTLRDLSLMQHYAWLAFYNLIYILPLALILVVFIVTLGRRRLSGAEGQALKLMAGLMMLGLGGLLVLNPAILNDARAGLAILVVAVLLALIRKWMLRRV
jgi:thiol-disulfide isomerase/thioredoxin